MKLAKADLVPTAANLLGRVRQLRGAGGGLRGVLRAGQRPPAPGHPPGPGGDARRRACPACTRSRPSRSPRRSGVTRRADAMSLVSFEGGQYSVPHQLAGQVVHVRRHGEQVVIAHAGPQGAGRGGPAPGHLPGQPAARRGALPARPARGAEPRAEGPHAGRGGVPRHRRRRRAVAGRGRRGRGLPGPVQDGPGGPARRPAREPSRSTGRSGRPPRRAGSPTATCAAILAHQASAAPGEPSRAGESRTLAQGTGGWAARDGDRRQAGDRRAADGNAVSSAGRTRRSSGRPCRPPPWSSPRPRPPAAPATRHWPKRRSTSRAAAAPLAGVHYDACLAVDHLDFPTPVRSTR